MLGISDQDRPVTLSLSASGQVRNLRNRFLHAHPFTAGQPNGGVATGRSEYLSTEVLPDRPFTGVSLGVSNTDAPVFSHVWCALSRDPSLDQPRNPSVESRNDLTVVKTKGGWAQLNRLLPGRCAASARVFPSGEALCALVDAVASAVIHKEGGMVVNAAMAELDGRAVLVLAGSTPGVSLSDLKLDQEGLSVGRMAVVPSSSGWVVWPLPHHLSGRWSPLSALVSLVCDGSRTEYRLSATEAEHCVRAALAQAGQASACSVTRLCEQTKVYQLPTVQEEPLPTAIARLLGSE